MKKRKFPWFWLVFALLIIAYPLYWWISAATTVLMAVDCIEVNAKSVLNLFTNRQELPQKAPANITIKTYNLFFIFTYVYKDRRFTCGLMIFSPFYIRGQAKSHRG